MLLAGVRPKAHAENMQTPPNDQLERIWKQIYSGTQYPGWRADRNGTLDVLSRLAPEASWTRAPPNGPWEPVSAPERAADLSAKASAE